MSLKDIILSFFELSAIVLLIIGFINEKKVVAFEQKLWRKIKLIKEQRRTRRLAASSASSNVIPIFSVKTHKVSANSMHRNCFEQMSDEIDGEFSEINKELNDKLI